MSQPSLLAKWKLEALVGLGLSGFALAMTNLAPDFAVAEKPSAQKKPPIPFSPEVTHAWKKAWADFSWMKRNHLGEVKFHSGPAEGIDLEPWFSIGTWKKGIIAKLPSPDIPFGLIIHNKKFSDSDLKELAGLENLHSLRITGTRVTGSGLRKLAKLEHLHSINMRRTNIKDAGLQRLSELIHLSSLNLSKTSLTDSRLKKLVFGLKRKSRLNKLKTLNLADTQITSKGMKALTMLEGLENLNLFHVKAKDQGAADLVKLNNLKSLNFVALG